MFIDNGYNLNASVVRVDTIGIVGDGNGIGNMDGAVNTKEKIIRISTGVAIDDKIIAYDKAKDNMLYLVVKTNDGIYNSLGVDKEDLNQVYVTCGRYKVYFNNPSGENSLSDYIDKPVCIIGHNRELNSKEEIIAAKQALVFGRINLNKNNELIVEIETSEFEKILDEGFLGAPIFIDGKIIATVSEIRDKGTVIPQAFHS